MSLSLNSEIRISRCALRRASSILTSVSITPSPSVDKPHSQEHCATPNVSSHSNFFCRKGERPNRDGAPPRWRRFPDPHNRLIVARFGQLEAERHTRETRRQSIRSGAMDPAVLAAVVEDQVPAFRGEIAALERTIAFRERIRREDGQQPEDWR